MITIEIPDGRRPELIRIMVDGRQVGLVESFTISMRGVRADLVELPGSDIQKDFIKELERHNVEVSLRSTSDE